MKYDITIKFRGEPLINMGVKLDKNESDIERFFIITMMSLIIGRGIPTEEEDEQKTIDYIGAAMSNFDLVLNTGTDEKYETAKKMISVDVKLIDSKD